MNDAKKVTFGKPMVGGAIFAAPLGTTLPTSSIEELDEAFAGLGYVSEDGLSNENSPETEAIKAWGGDTVLVVQQGKPDKFSFKLIEAINIDVLKTVYGPNNVSGDLDTGITLKANSGELPSMSYVIDMILKGGILKRIVIPHGSIDEIEEIIYSDSDAVGYGLGVQALPDSQGNSHYEYIKSGATGE